LIVGVDERRLEVAVAHPLLQGSQRDALGGHVGAEGAGNRGVRPATSATRLRRAYPTPERVGPGLYLPRPAQPPPDRSAARQGALLGATEDRLVARPAALRRFLKRAGL
jgi:hypothetical protein